MINRAEDKILIYFASKLEDPGSLIKNHFGIYNDPGD